MTSRVYHNKRKQGNHRKLYMVIYENMKVVENSIEVYGNMQVIKRDHTVVWWFHASHTLYHSTTIVWKSMREFYHIMITYSSEQKFYLKYSWKLYIKVWSWKFLAIIWLGNIINAIYVHFCCLKLKMRFGEIPSPKSIVNGDLVLDKLRQRYKSFFRNKYAKC